MNLPASQTAGRFCCSLPPTLYLPEMSSVLVMRVGLIRRVMSAAKLQGADYLSMAIPWAMPSSIAER
jgi:hypothetical protein